ncbi:hypothetical protein RhoFasB10_05198 [Rhodococcus sp. B10]|nr:hypothetical protein [Rhodococcus sp. B10]
MREAQAAVHRQIGVDALTQDLRFVIQPLFVDRTDAVVPLLLVFEDLCDRAQVVRIVADIGAEHQHAHLAAWILAEMGAIHARQQFHQAVRDLWPLRPQAL